jgi:Leucine-rich repeat (LRR) protein
MLTLGLSLTLVASGWAVEPNADQARAIAEIKILGGTVTVDETSPGKPMTVFLAGWRITDAMLEHLKGLPQLQSLGLMKTWVTDAGLAHLKELPQLRMLSLMATKITDAGMEHLKGLTQLQSLSLTDTNVSDAGLEHLKGLTKLQVVWLVRTKVTDDGVKKLRQALPTCRIER